MDFLIEIAGEIVIEVYLELMMLIVPEEKQGKKFHVIAKIIAITIMIGIIAMIVGGIILIENQKIPGGVALISTAGAISLTQIILGIVFYKRNHTED